MHICDQVAIELSLLQCGVFGRWQLLPRGVTDRDIKRRLRTGHWVRHAPGVYGMPSIAASFEQRCWTGWLAVGPDAVVSHEAAAELRVIPNVVRGRVTLITSHSNYCRIPGTFVHQISDVLPEHRTAVAGLPVTTVPRTVVDLASVVHPARLRSVVEDTKHAGLTTYAAIGECLATVARRGKPGVRPLTRVLDQLSTTKAKSQSKLESALIDLLIRAAITEHVQQNPLPGWLFTNGCVDVAFLMTKLIIEADGRSWHTRIRELKRDHERDAEAARHGWQVLRLLYEHIVGDPEGTIALIRDVLRERRLLLAS
jgi:very-short-patch-repair endonuclease